MKMAVQPFSWTRMPLSSGISYRKWRCVRMSPPPSARRAVRFRVADAAADGQRGRRAAEEVDGGRVAGRGEHLVVAEVRLAFLRRAAPRRGVNRPGRAGGVAKDGALCFERASRKPKGSGGGRTCFRGSHLSAQLTEHSVSARSAALPWRQSSPPASSQQSSTASPAAIAQYPSDSWPFRSRSGAHATAWPA